MLDDVLGSLRCPVCGSGFARAAGRVVCPSGHAFDVARQGYLNLAVGDAQHGTADTVSMVTARERFLARGHYAPIAAAVAAAVAHHAPNGLAVDLAGGTGYYLAAVLDAHPAGTGVCVDLSTAALRRAARAHPRAAAIGADVWRPLPFVDGCARAVLSVFGPRNADEIARVLAPGGALVTVTPTPDHLRELISPLGMLRVDPRKEERTAATLARFDLVAETLLTQVVDLDRDDAVAAAAMGPAGQHATAEQLVARVVALADRTAVTVSVRVATYR